MIKTTMRYPSRPTRMAKIKEQTITSRDRKVETLDPPNTADGSVKCHSLLGDSGVAPPNASREVTV